MLNRLLLPRARLDYPSLTLEQLQERYDKAEKRNNTAEMQMLRFEAKRRGAKLRREEHAM